eukprot:4388674-Pleurochrysis_carterae.AAC.1
MKHAFEVPQLLHDPGSASAMLTAPLNLNLVVKNAFLCPRFWCSSTKQMQELNDFCRYMTERHLSKYVSSTRDNSCDSFSGFAEAHEVTEVFVRLIVAIERYLEPEDFAADSDGSSNSTFGDDGAGPSAEILELPPAGSADAEALEETGSSPASPYTRRKRAVAESEERWQDIQALMDAMEARTKLN